MFVYTLRYYTRVLRQSIDDNVRDGLLPVRGNPVYYTYLLIDGFKLCNILRGYLNGSKTSIKDGDLDEFGNGCFYVGMGKNDRKFQHAIDGKKAFTKQLPAEKISAKFSKIAHSWETGHGIAVVQLFSEFTHYEAHAREFAIIKALGLSNITNVINGTPYGAMKLWNHCEVINFGRMLLFNAFSMCVMEPPRIIMQEDIILPNPRVRTWDWELEGILRCFLDLGTSPP
jgi:hypothetical protein